MPVRSPGARSSGSSDVFAYSNSKPTTRRPMPSANPRAWRLAGVEFVPMNAVASANAGEATPTRSAAAMKKRAIRIPDDNKA